MAKAIRSVLAILAGLVAGFITVGLIESANAFLYPAPAGVDLARDQEAFIRYVSQLPVTAFLIVVVAEWLGVFLASWVAARLAGRAETIHGLVVGTFFLLATLINLLTIPHPVWMWVLGLGGPLPLAFLGSRLAVRGKPEKAATTPDHA